MNTNPCCDRHNFQPYSTEWYECIDSQPEEADTDWFVDEPEYLTADVAYDMRGGATPDAVWYGDDPYWD